jgi:hypothetical protein
MNDKDTPDVWIILMGSNPDFAQKDDRAGVLMQSLTISPDKNAYKRLYDGNTTSVSLPFDHGIFTVS